MGKPDRRLLGWPSALRQVSINFSLCPYLRPRDAKCVSHYLANNRRLRSLARLPPRRGSVADIIICHWTLLHFRTQVCRDILCMPTRFDAHVDYAYRKKYIHLPIDSVSSSAIIGFDTTPGSDDASVMRNCTWSHSFFVFTICISTSVPCSFFATVYFKSKLEFLRLLLP